MPGPRRDSTVDAAFEGLDIEGKSVWVVGSHYGAVPNILADRGARRVVGWDARPAYCQIAQTVAEIRGTDSVIAYACTNVEHAMPVGQFDVVTLFNVTHHLYYPAHTLVQVASRAREALLIEWATLETYNARHGSQQVDPEFMAMWPIFLADRYGCWYCSQSALDAVLGRCDFRSVQHKPSPLGTHRRITVCQR